MVIRIVDAPHDATVVMDVRDAAFDLVWSGVIAADARQIALDTRLAGGVYSVRARWPDGATAARVFEVDSDASWIDAEVLITPPERDVTPIVRAAVIDEALRVVWSEDLLAGRPTAKAGPLAPGRYLARLADHAASFAGAIALKDDGALRSLELGRFLEAARVYDGSRTVRSIETLHMVPVDAIDLAVLDERLSGVEVLATQPRLGLWRWTGERWDAVSAPSVVDGAWPVSVDDALHLLMVDEPLSPSYLCVLPERGATLRFDPTGRLTITRADRVVDDIIDFGERGELDAVARVMRSTDSALGRLIGALFLPGVLTSSQLDALARAVSPSLADADVAVAWALIRESDAADDRAAEVQARLLAAAGKGLPLTTRALRLLRDGLDLFSTPACRMALHRLKPFLLRANAKTSRLEVQATDPNRPLDGTRPAPSTVAIKLERGAPTDILLAARRPGTSPADKGAT